MNRNTEIKQRHRAKHPERYKARSIVTSALKSGKLKRGVCAVCGTSENIEAHHPDYSKPLEVEWLCSKHHRNVSKTYDITYISIEVVSKYLLMSKDEIETKISEKEINSFFVDNGDRVFKRREILIYRKNHPRKNDVRNIKGHFLDIKEAAEYLELSVRTIYQCVWRKEIQTYKKANLLRFKKEDLDNYLNRKSEMVRVEK